MSEPDSQRLDRLDTRLSIIQRIAVVVAIMVGGMLFLIRQEGQSHVELNVSAQQLDNCVLGITAEFKNLKGRVWTVKSISATLYDVDLEPVIKVPDLSLKVASKSRVLKGRYRVGEGGQVVLALKVDKSLDGSTPLVLQTRLSPHEGRILGNEFRAVETLVGSFKCNPN